MNCPKCNQPVQEGAEFCGNCGQALTPTTAPAPDATGQQAQMAQVLATPPTANTTPNLTVAQPATVVAPAAAAVTAVPGSHPGETKAIVGLVLACLAIPAAFIPILGLALGITGLVLGTISRQYYKKTLSLLAIIFGGLAIVLSLASWVYAVVHDPSSSNPNSRPAIVSNNDQNQSSSNLASDSLQNISTACYSFSVPKTLLASQPDGCQTGFAKDNEFLYILPVTNEE